MCGFFMRRIVLMLGLLMLAGFSSAHDVGYKERYVETRTVFVDYDNNDRHSTYDYRHGYSYRATRDYFERKHGYDSFDDDWRDRHYVKSYDRYDSRYSDSGRMGHRYEYVPHLRTYEVQDCYVTPPADRLFYVAC